MAKLRKMLTHPRKNESGQGVLAMVLILLMLGAIILTPLLVFMSTGLKAGGVYESKMQEFYAADAGVEDAIWNITGGLNISVSHPLSYTLDEKVNDRDVNVTIQNKGGGIYKIISTATSDTWGNATIECYVLNIAGFNFFDNAITSNGDVTIQPNNNITGNVTANGTVNYNEGDINGTINEGATIIWPSALQLSTWYSDDVNKSAPYSEDHIDIATDPIIGPLYRNGTLEIYNGGSAGKNATLNGTVYVTDDLTIGTTKEGHNFTLNLNNQTIYCESDITVGGGCTISGSGCIIAVGDVDFGPNIAAGSENDFVFIMSVEGEVFLHPNGNFYGAIAGEADVRLQPGYSLTLTAVGEGDVNFPTEGMGMMKVLSYTIK